MGHAWHAQPSSEGHAWHAHHLGHGSFHTADQDVGMLWEYGLAMLKGLQPLALLRRAVLGTPNCAPRAMPGMPNRLVHGSFHNVVQKAVPVGMHWE